MFALLPHFAVPTETVQKRLRDQRVASRANCVSGARSRADLRHCTCWSLARARARRRRATHEELISPVGSCARSCAGQSRWCRSKFYVISAGMESSAPLPNLPGYRIHQARVIWREFKLETQRVARYPGEPFRNHSRISLELLTGAGLGKSVSQEAGSDLFAVRSLHLGHLTTCMKWAALKSRRRLKS